MTRTRRTQPHTGLVRACACARAYWIRQGLIHTTQGARNALLHHVGPSPQYQQR
jgi:hypothetical protein